MVASDPLRFSDTRPYPERLAAARRKSRRSESITTGRATLDARRSRSSPASTRSWEGAWERRPERVARAFERAQEARLPLLAVAASGGTRMQEGALAFVQMVKAA